MKALVVYDSQFGNTEKIAQAIYNSLSEGAEVQLLPVRHVSAGDFNGIDLLVVGSPTQRFHATEPVDQLLVGRSLKNVRAAAFDTRFKREEVDVTVLRLAMKVAGDAAYAAPRIGSALEKAGAVLVVPPEGFYVEDTEGPLKAGELDRAAEWAGGILAAL